jgi:surface protein
MNTRELYIKAQKPSVAEWVRPSDWLPIPTNITESDQIFIGLHAVIEDNDNYVAFLFTTSTGQYQVDWGDGSTPTLHDSNTIAQYEYDFATISNSTLTNRGYKQAIITVTPVIGNLLTCNFQQRFVTTPAQNQPYSTGFLDCILSMPNANTGASILFGGTTVRHRYVERFNVKTIGNCTGMGNMFNGCNSLQQVPLFNTQNVTIMSNMFNGCNSLQQVPLFNTQNVTIMSNMFSGCFSLQQVPLFNTQNGTGMGNMFSGCNSLQQVPLFNTQNVTIMSNMFSGCSSLNSIPALSTQSITTTSGTDFGANFATGSNSLNRCQMVFARTVSFANCQLSRDALVEIFTNLVDRSSTTSANINITGNWGATALSTADRDIALNKNWTITG